MNATCTPPDFVNACMSIVGLDQSMISRVRIVREGISLTQLRIHGLTWVCSIWYDMTIIHVQAITQPVARIAK